MASGKEEAKAMGTYYSMVEGKFRTKVDEDTQNAEFTSLLISPGYSDIFAI